MTGSDPVVFLVDADNTRLDNDRIQRGSQGASRARLRPDLLRSLLGHSRTAVCHRAKPFAPLENRGELKPIAMNVPGIPVCELLP
jgi:hypothetical protein